MATDERAQMTDLTKHIIATIIDIGRAVSQGGAENRIAALDHAEEIVDAFLAMEDREAPRV